jgi:BirA family biotin operon repressor/biotin-[acetyl-CoA-carboxylase] ligase
LPEASSTNDLVWKEAQSGHPEGLIIAADKQTKGRGRQGRIWESPKVCGLYATVLLRPGWPVYHAARITILVSLALAEALETLCRTNIEIKWPNDLFIRGKKLGGILTEMASDPEKILFAVVGFGINISQKKTDFSPDTRDKATSLFIQTGQPFRRADVLVKILQTLSKVYAEPFLQVRKRWLERCLTVGKTVTVRTPSGEVTGQALDIDENGALILRGESGRSFVLTAGDVL